MNLLPTCLVHPVVMGNKESYWSGLMCVMLHSIIHSTVHWHWFISCIFSHVYSSRPWEGPPFLISRDSQCCSVVHTRIILGYSRLQAGENQCRLPFQRWISAANAQCLAENRSCYLAFLGPCTEENRAKWPGKPNSKEERCVCMCVCLSVWKRQSTGVSHLHIATSIDDNFIINWSFLFQRNSCGCPGNWVRWTTWSGERSRIWH